MKKIIIGSIIILLVAVLTSPNVKAQGTVFVSSLGQTPTGSTAAGSDSWLATSFRTGGNASGYALNSVQLGMTSASGNPSGFTAMIYSAITGSGINPGSSLGTLDGSLNPATAGTYTYTDDSNIILSRNTDYFIVLTSGTTIANGAYDWSVTSTFSPSLIGGWHGDNLFANSSDGLSWNLTSGAYPLFSITATAIPEPSSSVLLLLGSGIFIYIRRAFRR